MKMKFGLWIQAQNKNLTPHSHWLKEEIILLSYVMMHGMYTTLLYRTGAVAVFS